MSNIDADINKKTGNPLDLEAQGSDKHPLVFISYAWGDPQHKDKVRLFADRLMASGVRVMLDQYEIQPGQDLNAFMENCVTNPEVDNVLIIADEIYTNKANERKGGVGSETQLISAEVYPKIDQTKFIPLVFEKDKDGKPFLPAFIKTRFNIDLSDEDKYETGFQTLLRHLWGEPELVKPILGNKPVFEGLAITPAKVKEHKTPVGEVPSVAVVARSVKQVLADLGELRELPQVDLPRDERMWGAIAKMKPYRDEILQIIEKQILRSKHDKNLTLDLEETITEVLTTLQEYTYPPPGVNQWGSYDYDHFSFLVNELAIQIMALLVGYQRYTLIHRILTKTYFYTTNTDQQQYGTYEEFRHYIAHLDQERNNRLKLNRVSVTADLFKERADYPGIGFRELINADLLLYIGSRILHPEENKWWFPRLSVYYDRGLIKPLGEMVSKERALEIMKMFGCSNVEELKSKIELAMDASAQRPGGFDAFNYNIPRLSQVFPTDIALVE